MKFWKKKIIVPESNEVEEMESVQLWEVRWFSQYGTLENYPKYREELETFYSEEDAQRFADALRNAFKLIRYKHVTGNTLSIEKAIGGI